MPPIPLRLYALRLELSTAQPIPDSNQPGIWLRGLLGRALFYSVCPYAEQAAECRRCPLRSDCLYPAVFKPAAAGVQRLPGYWLQNERIERDRRRARVDLMLAGPAVRAAEPWLRALARPPASLAIGGAPLNRLERATDRGSGATLVEGGRPVAGQALQPLGLTPVPAGPLQIRLATPLVSKHRHADPLYPPLRTRLRRLLQAYGEADAWPADPGEQSPWSLRAVQWRRRSVNAGRRRLEGCCGTLELERITPAGRRLLGAAVWLHAGGETSQGLGCIRWERL